MTNIINFFNNITLDTIIDYLFAIAIILVFFLFSELFATIIVKSFYKAKKDSKTKGKINYKKSNIYIPLLYFFRILGIYIGLLIINLPDNALLFINKIFKICVIILVTHFIACLFSKSSPFYMPLRKKLNLSKDDAIISLISKILRVIIYLVGAVIVISEIGYDINGLIAGLGLGGVVVALAAQDTAKNLFGGFVILLDRPFIVGNWIELPESDIEGTVEDITFRSTRIRTFKDAVITIPNSTISNASIINWSKMNTRRINFDIDITADTPLKKVSDVINKIKILLENHPNVDNQNMYIHFNEISSNGYRLMIWYFSKLTTYSDYLDLKENINYQIMSILKSENVKIAYNTYDIHITK